MSLPKLEVRGLHFVYQRGPNRLKAFDRNGGQLLDVECRNRTTADGQYGHDGNCPPGDFLIGLPSPQRISPFGPWFVPLLDFGANHAMAEHGRSGIGMHGGGSGLADSFAPRQSPPWVVTHGCLRLVNVDLVEVVHLIRSAQGTGAACYLTVEPPLPGAAEGSEDYREIDANQLAPGE